ncbi:WASH complex subunit 2 isoform X3 [Lampris incognitus]|uniref:WASH complex subunit 2 isoform X3 n=1 Tax=Lampris incognitus TaxID=2546036 RepID=UPI0024B619F7|nr:WASH complex subunit 2 isoform X3 [Lampris incognitus]
MSGLPDGTVNGPTQSNHLGIDAQVWERPWSLEEIRQTSANWSLAADSGLFLFLQDFSQRMLSKTHEIEKQLDGLIRDTKATDSCLHSVFNDFLMLSNTQFIENRVYDEEVEDTAPKADTVEKQPEQEKTREQKEAELIPKMQEAVNFGLRVLDSAFEQLDIKAGNSDSEDEEATDKLEAILEPKDLYVDRPLPYLIGSQAFMEQDDVGLGDLSSDDMSIDSDQDSVIESEDSKDAIQSDEEFGQEDEDHSSVKKSSVLNYEEEEEDEEEDEDSDIFGESDKEDDEDDRKNRGSSSFADELAARIKSEPVGKQDEDRTSLTSKKKGKGKKEPKPARPAAAEDDSDDMFKPPKMEDDDFSPFGGKSGLFSGGKGLFDDDFEGDLFSEAPKPPMSEEKTKSTTLTSKSSQPGKKIPSGAVSVHPDNGLFGSDNESDSVRSKKNGTSVQPKVAAAKRVPTGVGGLFDEDDDEDDFFSDKSVKNSCSVSGQETSKPKKTVDLFAEDDEDSEVVDIFSENSRAETKKEVEDKQAKPPEKKMPAGAVSLFGADTKSILTEGLRKRQPSTSEESEENGPPPDVVKVPAKQIQKPQTRGLFSDDEDSQMFPTIPKSQSKPESTSQAKVSKAPLSIFDDDDEEEDLFASVAKSKPKPTQGKASTPQPKTLPSSLFSDDEDQWLSSKPSEGKPATKAGGMKPSASAPSTLPSGKTSQKGCLFDDDEDDDLFATKQSSQKKPQRVALLFEDEDDEDKGSLFGFKPAASTTAVAPAAKTSLVASPALSLFDSEQPEEVEASRRVEDGEPFEQETSTAKSPEAQAPSSPSEGGETKRTPVGAVSLFGGANVLANEQTKSALGEVVKDDELLSKDDTSLPKKKEEEEEKKEERVKAKTVSLFDDEEEEEEEDDADWNASISVTSKPGARSTLKPAEERPRTKSTGVFQDEELLFSQTQQKDNDPDVDLFATSGKAASTKPTTVTPDATSLFADDDGDDFFSSVKPKAPPPKVAEKPSKPKDKAPLKLESSELATGSEKPASSPVKPKEPSSRVGKLQASLVINPSALLPGAVRNIPGAVGVLPGLAPGSSSGVSSSSLTPSPVTNPLGSQAGSEVGVSFDSPVTDITTLQSANRSRTKGSVHRRPQSRTARQLAAQRSVERTEESWEDDRLRSNPSLFDQTLRNPGHASQTLTSSAPLNSATTTLPESGPSLPSLTEVSSRPSDLTLPVSTNNEKKDSPKESSSARLPLSSDEDDLFGSDSLFGATQSTKPTAPSSKHINKASQDQASGGTTIKKEKSTLPSIFDDPEDNLFQKVKPKSTTNKAKVSSFMVDDDDEEDLFGMSNSSTPVSRASKDTETSGGFTKKDIFQNEVATAPKAHKKQKDKPLDASLFDDNVDIFADLTTSSRPKEKIRKKMETKSIFDDDMDDIFSSSTVKPVTKAPTKSKKTPPSHDSSAATDSGNIFDDPLNALGGN